MERNPAAVVDHSKFFKTIPALFSLALALAACATPPTDPAARAQYDANNDPLEPMNRQIFAFDMFIDKWFIKPVAQTYRAVVPEFGRDAVRNFLNNLHEPVIFANNVVQTEFTRAGWTAERFAINSTVGVGGMFDWASKWGVDQQSGDFGQVMLCQVQEGEHPLQGRGGLVGVQIGHARQGRQPLVPFGVVLHGTGAQRIHARVHAKVPLGEADVVPDHVHLAHLGEIRDLAGELCGHLSAFDVATGQRKTAAAFASTFP